jgi:type IV pilus assembly protein PilA
MRTHNVRVARHRGRSDSGFTLIELMLVVAIIAILILIALPTFIGSRDRAEDRRAQSILHSSLVVARIGAADQGDYAWVTPATLQAEEHSVTITDAATQARAGSNQVSIATGTAGAGSYVIMATMSSSGKCFAVLEQTSAPTTYQAVVAANSCTAGDFDPVNGWTPAW